jgi:Low-density lipoprotein receptor repeat class B
MGSACLGHHHCEAWRFAKPRFWTRRSMVHAALPVLSALALLGLAAPAQAMIYWSSTFVGENAGTTIGRADLNGTHPDKSFITGADQPQGVALDGSHIYWANWASGTIGRADLDGTNVQPSFIGGLNGPCGVAVTSTHVYWVNENTNSIGEANIDGTDPNPTFIARVDPLPAFQAMPCHVAVFRSHIYWGNGPVGSMGRATLAGTQVDRTFIKHVLADGIAFNAKHIYFGNGDRIGRADLDGTGVDRTFIVLSPNVRFHSACGVAIDSKYIYWADCSANTVGRADLDGKHVQPSFMKHIPDPRGIAVNALKATP